MGHLTKLREITEYQQVNNQKMFYKTLIVVAMLFLDAFMILAMGALFVMMY